MSKIRLYVEGGKPLKQPANKATKDNDRELREGLQVFLSKALDGKLLQIVCAGSGSGTCKRFVNDWVKKQDQEVVKFLLVDSESEVITKDRRSHLKQGHGQGVAQELSKIEEKYCHLMVQEMEAWFIADEKALKSVFPNDYQAGKIPQIVDVEIYDKDRVNEMLYAATNRKYVADNEKHPHDKETKLRYSGRILKQIDPQVVYEKSKHFRELIDTLRSL